MSPRPVCVFLLQLDTGHRSAANKGAPAARYCSALLATHTLKWSARNAGGTQREERRERGEEGEDTGRGEEQQQPLQQQQQQEKQQEKQEKQQQQQQQQQEKQEK